MKHQLAKLHFAIALPLNHTDCRIRLSGALRFFSAKREIEVRVLDASAPTFNDECRRLSADWTIDGLIATNPDHFLELLKGHGAKAAIAMMDGPRSYHGAHVEIRMRVKHLTDEALTLFRKRGFSNFAFCGTETPLDIQYSAETEESFRKSAGKQTPVSAFHEKTGLSYNENLSRGIEWVTGLNKPCAVMCYSDVLARNLLNTCNLAHINVPEQIAILGVDNATEICELTRPTLTSALPDFEQSGYLAAQCLYQLLRRTTQRKQVIRKSYGLRTIVERSSTQDLRGCGRAVSAALELIRLTPPTELSADFISQKLHLSRRLLELHFKKVIGRGVHAEIIRMRLERIQEELLATSLPIERIAESCGYRTFAAAEIAFKKRFGVSMRETRRSAI